MFHECDKCLDTVGGSDHVQVIVSSVIECARAVGRLGQKHVLKQHWARVGATSTVEDSWKAKAKLL